MVADEVGENGKWDLGNENDVPFLKANFEVE
jgi:hypothetical protein